MIYPVSSFAPNAFRPGATGRRPSLAHPSASASEGPVSEQRERREGSPLARGVETEFGKWSRSFLGAKRDLGRRYVTRGRTVARNPSKTGPHAGRSPPHAPLLFEARALSCLALSGQRPRARYARQDSDAIDIIHHRVGDGSTEGLFLSRFGLSDLVGACGSKWL